jgi:glutamine amidotransferase
MCRHLAYLGPSVPLRSLLTDPPHSLYRQAWAPRLQRYGSVNADGFGIGLYAAGDRKPARYRRGEPIWGDPSLPDLARVISSGAVLAAVRSATPGMAAGAEAAAPFGDGPWLFSHNGVAERWRDWAEHAIVAAEDLRDAGHGGRVGDQGTGLPPASQPEPSAATALVSLEAMVDSAFLWLLVLTLLRAGLPMPTALAETIVAVEAAGGTGRFNFLLTDGHSIAATACGDTLWCRRAGGNAAASVVVASEPFDDQPGWVEVPDRHLLTATPRTVTVQPLAARLAQPSVPADLDQRRPTTAAG